MSARIRRLHHRPRRAVPALVLASGLLVLGFLGGWLLITRAVQGSWPAEAAGGVAAVSAARPADISVIAAAAVLGVLGLVMLLAAVVPGRHVRTLLPVTSAAPGETVISHRDLERRVRARLADVDGVDQARARLSGHRMTIAVTTPVDDTEAVRSAANAAVRRELTEMGLADTIRVRVATREN